MSGAMATGAAILTAIIGLAIVAVLISNQSNTSGVIKAASQGLSTIIGTAVSPVTNGGGAGSNLGSTSSGSGIGVGNWIGNSLGISLP